MGIEGFIGENGMVVNSSIFFEMSIEFISSCIFSFMNSAIQDFFSFVHCLRFRKLLYNNFGLFWIAIILNCSKLLSQMTRKNHRNSLRKRSKFTFEIKQKKKKKRYVQLLDGQWWWLVLTRIQWHKICKMQICSTPYQSIDDNNVVVDLDR